MFNYHFKLHPREILTFVNGRAEVHIVNISGKELNYKVRTTNNQDYTVLESNGILQPKQQKSITIECRAQVKAKFQIMTVIGKFENASDEQIQKAILKTAHEQSDVQSIQSDRSYLMNSFKAMTPITHTPELSRITQIDHQQYNVFHLFFTGLICLLIGYISGKYSH